MKNTNLYNKYSKYLFDKYKEKVYKLPINIKTTCPNRDGTIGTKGCYFCSGIGAGFELLDLNNSIEKQININKDYIGKRYGAKKYIAYFQNYTNTYLEIQKFKEYMYEACQDDIVEIDVSTRPDCISKEYLDILKNIFDEKNIQITIELGLQTTNEDTLRKINRGHDVNSFINAAKLINEYPFEVCCHLILNLPWDNNKDIINNAILINKLKIKQVKLHSLYIAKGSVFGNMYIHNEFKICSKDEYIDKVILFLEHLNSDTVVQRLIGRAPKEETIFCNWDTSWWKIRDEIESKMLELDTYQGKKLEITNYEQ